MGLRVVGAGLGRTGTMSLKLALERLLGAPCYHMAEVFVHPEHVPLWHAAARGEPVDWHALFDGYAAAVDWPVGSFWPEVAAAFPDALILLSTRSAESWWKSASQTIFPISAKAAGTPWHAMWMELAQRRFTSRLDDRAAAVAAYERRENDWGDDLTREVERRVMLSMIDEKWRDHLYEMDMLKEGIGLRAWGQKDPLIEYKREAYNAFEAMMDGLGEEIIRRFFRVTIVQQGSPGSEARAPLGPSAARPRPATRESHDAFSAFDKAKASATATSAPPEEREPVRAEKKVGRNDPCPCGSGKKYKKCHGR